MGAPSSVTLIPIGYILGTFAMGGDGGKGGPNDNAATVTVMRKPVTRRSQDGHMERYRAKITFNVVIWSMEVDDSSLVLFLSVSASSMKFLSSCI